MSDGVTTFGKRLEEHLGSLAAWKCGAWTLAEFRQMAGALGWVVEVDGDVGRITIDTDLFLLFYTDGEVVATDGDDVPASIVPLARWTEWDLDDHESEAQFQQSRQAFDRAFESFQARFESSWGAPKKLGTHVEAGVTYRHAAWPGVNGSIILAQTERDIQFGVEVLLWYCPVSAAADLPQFPPPWLG